MDKKDRLKKISETEDFYQSIRKKIKAWAEGKGKGHKYLEFILLAPDLVHLLSKLTLDPRVPLRAKAKLGFALAYFLSPFELLPEAVLGPVGFLDDIALAAWVLDDFINSVGREVVLEHWAGEGDIIEIVARIAAAANEMLGSGLVRKLKEAVRSQGLDPDLFSGKAPEGKVIEGEIVDDD